MWRDCFFHRHLTKGHTEWVLQLYKMPTFCSNIILSSGLAPLVSYPSSTKRRRGNCGSHCVWQTLLTSYTRQVPIRVAFLRAGKTPKSYQVLLAMTQYGTVSGVTPEKPSELHRHTSRATVTLLMLDGLQSLCECSSQSTHVSLPHGQCSRSPPCHHELPIVTTVISFTVFVNDAFSCSVYPLIFS